MYAVRIDGSLTLIQVELVDDVVPAPAEIRAVVGGAVNARVFHLRALACASQSFRSRRGTAGWTNGRMAMSVTELLALMCRLDDPERLKQPPPYDRAATNLAFAGPVRRVEADFGTPCDYERDTQDSSEYGRVQVPADATICGTRIVV